MKKKDDKMKINKDKIIVILFVVIVILLIFISILLFGNTGIESSNGNIIVQLGE